jgi:hypothetical protein
VKELFDVRSSEHKMEKERRNKHCGVLDDIWRLSGICTKKPPNGMRTLVAAWAALAAFMAWAYFRANHPKNEEQGLCRTRTLSSSHEPF